MSLEDLGQYALAEDSFRIGNSASREMLRVTYRSFEATVADTAKDPSTVQKALRARI